MSVVLHNVNHRRLLSCKVVSQDNAHNSQACCITGLAGNAIRLQLWLQLLLSLLMPPVWVCGSCVCHLQVHARNKSVDPTINWQEVARAMSGFTGGA